MSNILEIESNADSVSNESKNANQKKSDIEIILENTVKKAYILGLSNGTKAMSVSLIAKMKEMGKLNPKKQLIELRKMCTEVLKNQEKLPSSEANNSN